MLTVPSSSVSDIVKPIDPAIVNAIQQNMDLNPDGAQVRVTFGLSNGDKFSCDETKVKVTIFENPLPPDPSKPEGGLVSYPTLRTYTANLFASKNTNTCLYNFKLDPNFVGKRASVAIISSPVLPSRDRGFTIIDGGSDYFPAISIKSLRQTFSVKAAYIAPPN